LTHRKTVEDLPMEFEEIYASHAEEYDALVEAEDRDGNLIPAIEAIHPLAGATVLEVGVGTGRIARAMVGRVGRLVAVDRAPAMLAVARRHLSGVERAAPWELHEADARDLPVGDGWADVALAGWVFGHFREWMPDDWQAQVGRALAEMRRTLRPGGALIVIETLGTGREEPAAPTAGLDEYFTWLEREHGFERRAIRTDYQFPDVESAAAVTGFFFGDDFAALVRRRGWSRVPECTGLWSIRIGATATAPPA
jgi:ubiquinone/menaquinone biosynthesis C-methylase UbiE